MSGFEITNLILGSGGILGVAVIVFRFGKLVQKVDDIAVSVKETNQKIDTLDVRLNAKIERLDGQLVKIETRLTGIETRLVKVETRLDHVEVRLDKMEIRLEKVETNTQKIEVQLARVETRFEEREGPNMKEIIKNFMFPQKQDFPQVLREEKQIYLTSEDSV